MKNLILHPTDISQWYALVNEAQVAAHLYLNESTESYLVFLLQRFVHNTHLVDTVVAMDFLQALQGSTPQKIDQLRDVGDKSLLLCGLFPGLADRRRVTVEYYAQMGQTAYLSLSELLEKSSADLFLQLSQHFCELQKTLQSMRGELYQLTPESHGLLWVDADLQQH